MAGLWGRRVTRWFSIRKFDELAGIERCQQAETNTIPPPNKPTTFRAVGITWEGCHIAETNHFSVVFRKLVDDRIPRLNRQSSEKSRSRAGMCDCRDATDDFGLAIGALEPGAVDHR
jgi:hypothetical protein